MKKQLIIFCILLFMSKLCFANEDGGTEHATKLDTINTKIQNNNAKLLPKKRAKRHAEKTLSDISKQLRMTELKLRKAKKTLVQTKTKKENTEIKINDLEIQFTDKKSTFSKRLIYVYKIPELGLMEYLFSSNDLIMSSESRYYFDLLLKKDLELLKTLKLQKQELQQEKKQLEKQELKIVSIKKNIHYQESTLEKKRNEEKEIISSLKSEISELERKNRELMESSEKIAQLIRHETYGKEGYYGTGRFIKPVNGWISSKFGYRMHPIFKRKILHNGLDIAANTGYKIYASDSGFVLFAGQADRYRGYGKITILSHGKRASDKKEVSSFYAHQSKILVKKGDFVKQGDEIGWVGSTGYATGPHLHFEIRLDGKPVDPLSFLSL